jgi:hypothetical protein
VGDFDPAHESDYAKYVLTPPSYEQMLDRADYERKRDKENPEDDE